VWIILQTPSLMVSLVIFLHIAFSLIAMCFIYPNPCMSNPNGLLSQKLCHYLDQGRTLNDILLRVTHWMPYSDLRKLKLANILKVFEWNFWCMCSSVPLYHACSHYNENRRDKRHWGTHASKISKSRLSKPGQVVSCRILLLQPKPKLGHIKPSTAGWT